MMCILWGPAGGTHGSKGGKVDNGDKDSDVGSWMAFRGWKSGKDSKRNKRRSV